MNDIRTIGVVVGQDLVGDALMKLPFLRALRTAWPHACVVWITSHGRTAYADALRDATSDLIDRIEQQPSWLSDSSGPPAPHFDLLIDTRNRWREALTARRRVPHTLFIAPALRYLFSDRRPPLLSPRPPHLVDRLLQFAALAAGYLPASDGALAISPSDLAKARQSLPHGPLYVGLAPGAGNMAKAWPLPNFEKVAQAQLAKGRTPVFLLGPQEQPWHQDLAARVPGARYPLQDAAVWGPAIRLDQTLAVASLLHLAVANDSGTSHMLAAVDCPLISVFGPTSAAKLAPRVSRGRVIRAQDFGSDSLDAIGWEHVCDAIDSLVAEDAGAGRALAS